MKKRALMTIEQSSVSKKDAEWRKQHACPDPEVFRCNKDGAARIWSVAVQKLPPELLKFALNTVQDALPNPSPNPIYIFVWH